MGLPRTAVKESPVQKLLFLLVLVIPIALTACSDPAPTSTPVPPGVLSHLPTMDRETVLSSLSQAELACIDQDPERMVAALTGGGPQSVEEQARLIGCLDDDTVDQLFIATIVPGLGPLTVETSDCILAGLDVINPRAVITAGRVQDEPEKAMFGSRAAFKVAIACLTDEEWEKAAPASGISDQDRAGDQCLMAEIGGPKKYADAWMKTLEDDYTGLIQAGAECRVGISMPR